MIDGLLYYIHNSNDDTRDGDVCDEIRKKMGIFHHVNVCYVISTPKRALLINQAGFIFVNFVQMVELVEALAIEMPAPSSEGRR